MSEWTDSSGSEKENDLLDFQPPKKRLKLSAREEKQRFGQMVSSEELESISKGFVPKIPRKYEVGAFYLQTVDRFAE